MPQKTLLIPILIEVSTGILTVTEWKIMQLVLLTLDDSHYPPFPEDRLKELMTIATHGVELSFNNQIYKQLDKVAMCSPLGAALANIFLGFQ